MIGPSQIALRVRDVELLAPTLKRLVLEAADGGLLPTSAAGSHITLTMKGEARNWRNSYSITSAPGERQAYELIVRRVEHSRGGSAYVHERVGKGDVLQATTPHNLFPLAITARKHVLIGGGVGMTPLLSQVAALRGQGARFELHQFCSAGEAQVFERLLAPFAGPGIHIHPGRGGFDLDALLARQPLGSHVYVCGPSPMMEAVKASATHLGWPSTAVHHESFGDHSGGAPFAAVLARSGLEINVSDHQSLLEAVEAAGVEAPYLCRGGACGECLTKVLDGQPDHRDDFLTEEERASGELMMICVSRAKTPRLVLDL
jgi:ferredoxin-NADP reductase